MDRMIINAVGADGKRTQFQIRSNSSESVAFTIFQDDVAIATEDTQEAAREFIEMAIKAFGLHMEDIIQQEGTYSYAVAFERADEQTVIIRTME